MKVLTNIEIECISGGLALFSVRDIIAYGSMVMEFGRGFAKGFKAGATYTE